MVAYANFCGRFGYPPLFRSIDGYHAGGASKPKLISLKLVRLLIDAGADTSSAVSLNKTSESGLLFHGTPLAYALDCLRRKELGGKEASEEQMSRLKAVRRLLLRVEACHAVSWLWLRQPFLVSGAAGEDASWTGRNAAASDTQLRLVLPFLRRRRRGVLLAPLFRWDEMSVVLRWREQTTLLFQKPSAL